MTKPLSEMSRSELIDEAVQLQQRNADLAAHVERISRKIGHAPPIDNPTIAKWECDLNRLLEDSPETSLAHLKPQWQAEALERLYAESQGSGVINRGSLIDEAREYRRQAKEPTQ